MVAALCGPLVVALTTYGRYLVVEYCVGGLQDMLDYAPGKKFPIWQAHE